MAFPTTPSNGDEYTNALGTVYKYLDADNKWYIINAPINWSDVVGAEAAVNALIAAATNYDAEHAIGIANKR